MALGDCTGIAQSMAYHAGEITPMKLVRSIVATLTFASLVSLAVTLVPSRADACGGCIHVEGPAPSSVTQHRMVLSVSATQTTLWDQFSYAGNPSEFAWILPIRHDPAVRIAVADDRFMAMFDQLTAPILNQPPPPPGPCPTTCPDPCPQPPPDVTFSDASSSDSSVTVHREEVVGPYAVAIIGSEDPLALRAWLRANGYAVPASIEPILDHYVSLRMDFIAVRLRASLGINRMTPIRVTVPGYAPVLPLRMVAAGIGDKVRLDLLVFAGSRFEALNYPNAEMRNEDFVFDYATQSYPPSTQEDLARRRRTLLMQNNGRTWLTESADVNSRFNVQSSATQAERRWSSSACPPRDAGPVGDGEVPCVVPRASEDATIAMEGLGDWFVITRMSSELPSTALSADLQLGPQAANSMRTRFYDYGTLRNQPAPPMCPSLNCPATCQRDGGPSGTDGGPRTMDGGARAMDGGVTDGGDGGERNAPVVPLRCAVGSAPAKGGRGDWVPVALSTLGVALVRGRRRRA
ncbi:MAG: DUF2330 domain-containing protein [Deltaproteobacteria bacterium]|nr:DUF2330 domain-containing protein [Deltaproteobacteria bacterium]